jgi:hypothetical protein
MLYEDDQTKSFFPIIYMHSRDSQLKRIRINRHGCAQLRKYHYVIRPNILSPTLLYPNRALI